MKIRMHYLEAHLFDLCNLGCAGCAHFSPLVSENTFDEEVYLRAIKRLASVYNVEYLRLLGGEPLLNPRCAELLKQTRKRMRRTKIELVSNGLLIPQCDEYFWRVVKKNKIVICISRYPATETFATKGEQVLNDRGVDYRISQPIQTFSRFLTEEMGEGSYEKCHIRLNVLKGERLYHCALSAYVSYHNSEYGSAYAEEKGISVFSTPGEVEEYFRKPCPLCSYCSGGGYDMPWRLITSDVQSPWVIEKE